MTAIKWLQLAQNKLGAPTMDYVSEIALREYEQRIQEVTKILNEVIWMIQNKQELGGTDGKRD